MNAQATILHWVAALSITFTVANARGDSAEDQSAAIESAEVAAALHAFQQWTAAFQEGDYRQQWRLTDKHITRWWNRQQWREAMANAQKNNGDLVDYQVKGAAPATAADLPCTEMGHCFREGLEYVLIVIESKYQKVQPPQPEFVVMAKSESDWLFGGGSFLNRPIGESLVIMTKEDENRYRPRWSIQQ